ncbi:MAG: family transposase [Polaromonas sp.]|nr:family transposase [Polaromonas sp.]
MDKSDTQKELVGRTYSGVDGYCPLAVYLGRLGYCLELALRPGVQHSSRESEYNLERTRPLVASLVTGPLLVRADSGFCSAKLMQEISAQGAAVGREMAFIIKWNPCKAPVETIAAYKAGNPSIAWQTLRPGKRECVWQNMLDLVDVGNAANPARRVYRLTERTIDKHGNGLLLPGYVLEGWTTTLPVRSEAQDVMALYCDHATHEKFHAEFKSEMDLQRLPSGKFDTNYLVCRFAAVAMNLLHLIGPNTLNEPDARGRQRLCGI